jgi:mannose-6-phosphate isomerase-like protein (cupin superfamily)
MAFNDVFDFSFASEVPPGSGYELLIEDLRPRESATGRPTAMVTFQVTGGAPTEVVGRRFSIFYAREGRGAVYIRPLLLACGLAAVDGKVTVKPEDLLGKKIIADVTVEQTDTATWFRLKNVHAGRQEGRP